MSATAAILSDSVGLVLWGSTLMNRTPGSQRRLQKGRVAKPERDDPAHAFYRHVLDLLEASGIRFLVGGAYAFERHTGIDRRSCDFDVFVLPEDARPVLDHCKAHGYRTRLTHPHWLGKVYHQRFYVDIIFSSGNGLVRVDPAWFTHAVHGEVLGRRVRLCPVEEMIWSKSFVMERERFDGADVMHLIRAAGSELDWERLLERYGPFWRVLLGHLVFFGFTYPSERDRVPEPFMRKLLSRLREPENGPDGVPLCLGTLLSRTQYLPDLSWGYRDGRLAHRIMTPEDIARWTAEAGILPRATSRLPRPARRKTPRR
jgi:hypothetical protein